MGCGIVKRKGKFRVKGSGSWTTKKKAIQRLRARHVRR